MGFDFADLEVDLKSGAPQGAWGSTPGITCVQDWFFT
jgi:hypothetical protein